MQASEFVRLSGSSLLGAIRKARKEFKALAGQHDRSYSELVEEIIELSLDDVEVADWPAETVARFLTSAPAVLSNAIDVSRSGSNEGLSLPTLEALTDLVCNIGAGASPLLDSVAKKEICRLWIVSRLANGMALQELPAFNKLAASTLACFEVPEEELSSSIRDQVLRHLALSSGVAATPSTAVTLEPRASAPQPSNGVIEQPKIDERWSRPVSEESGQGESTNGLTVSDPAGTAQIRKDKIEYASPTNSPMPVEPVAPNGLADANEIQVENNYIANNNDDTVRDGVDPLSFTPQISAETEETTPRGTNKEPREASKGTIRNWQRPFGTEKDINTGLGQFIERLLRSAVSIEAQVQLPISQINQAKRQYEEWLGSNQNGSTTNFLARILQGGETISEKLLGAELPHEAFRVANVCAEIAKMLVPRNRERYDAALQGLMLLAFQAVTDSWRTDPRRLATSNRANDIEEVAAHLDAIGQVAFGTFFGSKDRLFVKVKGRVEADQLERLINQALARHFDLQLRHLLDYDRPQVREYVRTNMPRVYRLKLPEYWTSKREEWKRLLTDAGYDDVVRLLRDMGDLVDPNQVGQVLSERREEIIRAAGLNDYGRVCELLADSAKEMRTYLFFEAQRLLQYREPPLPSAQNEKTRNSMRASQRLVRTKDRASIERALVEFQQAWQLEIDNLEIQDWVAFLEAKTGNLQAAEQKLEQLQRRRGPKKNLVSDWNLAVLRYEQKNEPGAYQLLVPLLDSHSTDEDLTLVVLALSLKLDDRARFLSTVPQTMSIRYHPLALIIAHEMKNSQRVTDLMAQLSAQWRGKWELPSVEQRFGKLEEMRAQVVNRAIVEGQTEQLISWLEKRIRLNRNWWPDYVALAEVLEKWRQDVDGAFRALRGRLDAERKRSPRQKENDDPLKYQRTIDRACEDLLNLARRAKRSDLGTQAYAVARSAGARQDLLHAFAHFAPADDTKPERVDEIAEIKEQPVAIPIPQARDPRLADRLMWVNAGLTQIRNAQSYSEKSKEIEEFGKVVAEVSPHEAGEVLRLIGNITGVIETFLRTDPDRSEDRVARRTLYSRVSGYEKDLAQLLKGGALSQQLGALITPYVQALQQVVGDISRLAGVGPNLDLAVENPFISLESPSTTLVVRVTDRSERPVTDVSIEMISETPYVSIAGNRKRTIPRLESQRSELLSVPIERLGVDPTATVSEITIAASLRASAEGYPDVDLGIKKLIVPVRTFEKSIGVPQIPKLFQEAPLRPSAPELFQGRSLLLNSIKNSFYGGTQRERYFFDGIRRVGKTTILNFLPHYVPESVIPVISNFETFGVRGRFSSASVLHRFSTLTAESAKAIHNVEIDIPNEQSFSSDPGRAFSAFLSQLSATLPGKIPLLVIDEFQELLQEIAATGLGGNRDTLVLDQLRGHLDTGRLYALFTGSVRFDRLSTIAEHRLFGSLTRLPVSFLPAESVGSVLRTGLGQWATVPPESIAQVHQLTGGYPWLVQKYGLAIVDLLNSEHRTVVTPKDVEDITSEKILWDDTLFEFWWPKDQLGSDEERFVEWMFRKYPGDQRISIRNFLADVGAREQATFRRAFENLRAAEVLDSTQTEYLQFAGAALRRWLENQVSDGQLHIRGASEADDPGRGQAGIFIDHENLIKTLERIGLSRGVEVPRPSDTSRVGWFSEILKRLMDVGEGRVGRLEHRVAVSFWDRVNEAKVSRAYQAFDFQLKAPEETGKGNEVDFKLADEARRARERAQREKSNLTRAIVVTGDSDLSALVRGLKNDGVSVQVWGGSRATGDMYISVVGPENFVYLDDICGM